MPDRTSDAYVATIGAIQSELDAISSLLTTAVVVAVGDGIVITVLLVWMVRYIAQIANRKDE